MPGNEEGGEMAGLKSQTQGQWQERKITIDQKKNSKYLESFQPKMCSWPVKDNTGLYKPLTLQLFQFTIFSLANPILFLAWNQFKSGNHILLSKPSSSFLKSFSSLCNSHYMFAWFVEMFRPPADPHIAPAER